MMNNIPLSLDPNDDTLPHIHEGDYTFRTNILYSIIGITNPVGEYQEYSVEALEYLAKSTGIPKVMRAMAKAALAWLEEEKKRDRKDPK